MKWQAGHLLEVLIEGIPFMEFSSLNEMARSFTRRINVMNFVHWPVFKRSGHKSSVKFQFLKESEGKTRIKVGRKTRPIGQFSKGVATNHGLSVSSKMVFSLSCHIINPDRPNCCIMCLRSPHVTSSRRGVPLSINGRGAPATGSK